MNDVLYLAAVQAAAEDDWDAVESIVALSEDPDEMRKTLAAAQKAGEDARDPKGGGGAADLTFPGST